MGILSEFKEFAVKGNVVDLAVGVIIGGAFGKIVSSLVGDVVTPALGLLVGGVNFTSLALTLKGEPGAAGAVALKYGNFLQATFDFLIVAIAVFAMIKVINSMKRTQAAPPPPPPGPTPEQELLTEIRDLLKARNE
ncbi:MAG TPA: large-conductance mechanosensitive channel protein MscL [Polyangiaceae bacterium]|jgi:large conductance mechanosensitive channel|nr:large-conductance mechanosensitive channel protein MscL [Polyangiaceae bacterium]